MTEHDALPRPRHELSDASFRALLIAALCLGATLMALAAFAYWLFPGAMRDKTMTLPETASPALQSSPRAEMSDFRTRQLQQLNSLGWVDQTHGIVHVPIEDAMRKLARDGIPGWPTQAPP